MLAVSATTAFVTDHGPGPEVLRQAAEGQGRRRLDPRALHVEILAPSHYATPLHRHDREDEAFWVLEGETTFEVGGETVEGATWDLHRDP
jgi:mannose-6-phosphate isomerase-like protein (cupin superfamily)